MLSQNYINSMKLGFIYQEYLQDHYEEELDFDMDELGKAVEIAVSNTDSSFDALKRFMNCLDEMKDGKEYYTEEFYNDYSRGFLAGEILGHPSNDTLELAKKAEHIWNTDQSIGYYQDVLNDIRDEKSRLENELKHTVLSLLCYAQDNHMYEHDRNSLLKELIEDSWMDADILKVIDEDIYQEFMDYHEEINAASQEKE